MQPIKRRRRMEATTLMLKLASRSWSREREKEWCGEVKVVS